jgi:Ca-activated chloride channel homolog
VSFQAPLFLLALLLVPVAVLVYRRVDDRRRVAADEFVAPHMLPSVAPSAPGWRRHAPTALYVAALAAVALALARPEATVAVPEERASVVLATDQSGSMEARDVSPSRLEAARAAAGDFLDDVPDELRVGVVAFNHAVRSIEAPTADRDTVRSTLDRLRSSGGTATGEALAASLRVLERPEARSPRSGPAPSAIVLLSDGASTHGREPLPLAREAARLRIPIYTVALGTDSGTIAVDTPGGSERRRVPPDRETLRRLAQTSGGQYFEATDGLKLDAVYERLGSEISTRDEQRQITAFFAAGAALLLVGGGAISLHWFGRLP